MQPSSPNERTVCRLTSGWSVQGARHAKASFMVGSCSPEACKISVSVVKAAGGKCPHHAAIEKTVVEPSLPTQDGWLHYAKPCSIL